VARYLTARLIGTIPTVLLLVLVVVLIARIVPGNVIDAAIADQGQLSSKDRAAVEHELGLDRPIWAQYGDYLGAMARGSLGESLWTRKSVSALVGDRIGVTATLAVMALAMAIAVSIPLGVWSAVRANRPDDYCVRIVAVLGLSVPAFVVATYVMLLPAIWWGWLVPTYEPTSAGLDRHLRSLLIPAAILAFELSAGLIRITRTSVLETLRQDYVRTARSKGLSERIVIVRHVLRNSLIPVVSVVGIQLVALFSGVVIIEQIFGIGGIGDLLVSGFTTRDYTLVQGITVLLGILAIAVNILIDVSYVWLDPRIRLG
jgi:peptide/nickel transport system permease protein